MYFYKKVPVSAVCECIHILLWRVFIFDCFLPVQVQIGTLAPPDYSYPVPEASLEEQQQEQEEDEEEEIHLRPQLTPQGSGGSGILMGPETQKGLEKHIPLGIITTEFSYIQTVGPHSLE